MDLYEYQGRDLFERHGLPVLAGGVATTPEEARAIAERLGGRVVVKAQVKVGGRGKAGGVKLAEGAEEAVARATDILGMDIKGHTVHKVMITVTADVAEEYYFSYLLDRANRTFLCIASVAGGMDIEQVAAETPEKVVKAPIDADDGRRRGEGPRDRRPRPASRPRSPTRSSTIAVEAVAGVRRRGRHAGRGQPAGQDRRRQAAAAWTPRSPWTRTPRSGTRTTRRWSTRPRWTRWSRPPRPRTSTTSSSTARSASSATARAWSCPPSTSSRTPVSGTAASSRPTSSTSAAARAPR